MRVIVLFLLLTTALPAGWSTQVTEESSGANTSPLGICVGPDGNIWYATNNGVASMNVNSFAVFLDGQSQTSGTAVRPINCVSGPDSNVWAAEQGGEEIARVVPASSTITTFPTNAGAGPYGACVGPDGNIWFCEHSLNQVGMCNLSASGTISEFQVGAGGDPEYICSGPDGNLWFTEPGLNRIGMIAPSGLFSTFHDFPCGAQPRGIIVGPDGNLWFTEFGADKLGVMNTAGALLAEYPVPTIAAGPYGLCVGPDGNIWFCENAVNQIGVFNRSNGVFSEYPITTPTSGPTDICTGPGLSSQGITHQELWFCENSASQIGILDPANPPAGTTSNGTGGSGTDGNFPPPLNGGSSAKCGLGASGMGLLALLALVLLRARTRVS